MHATAKQKSLVVVLGMHRSGTSAVTRGLQVIGVELGSKLMPAAPGVNDKGFFEDTDIHAFNDELLKSLGFSWHSLALITSEQLLAEKQAPLRLRAIALLREKLQDTDCFGLKDPRICRLLPFWQDVFDVLQLKVSYVIVARNPLSVAQSLAKVHKLPTEKSYYLWLEHVLSSISQTKGCPRLLIDYDDFMDSPEIQLGKIARTLDLDHDLDAERLSEFCDNFLENDLRHTRFSLENLIQDPLVPTPIKIAQGLLTDILNERLTLDSAEAAEAVAKLSEQMQGMAQAMSYLLKLDYIIEDLSSQLHEQKHHVDSLLETIVEDKRLSAKLTHSLAERETTVAALEASKVEQTGRIEQLTQSLFERETTVAALEASKVEQTGRIEQLTQSIFERETMVAALEANKAEQTGRIEQLTQSLFEREKTVAALEVNKSEQAGRINQLTQALAERETTVAALEVNKVEQAGRINELTQALAEREKIVAALEVIKVEQAGRINELTQALAEREKTVADLEKNKVEQAGRISQLTQSLVKREKSVADLEVNKVEQAGRIDQLRQTIVEREKAVDALEANKDAQADRINHLTQTLAAKDAQNSLLQQELSWKESALQHQAVSTAQFSYRLDRMRSTPKWKMRKAARNLRNTFSFGKVRQAVGLIPFHQLKADGGAWVADGPDPQFLLATERSWRSLPGWYWLEFQTDSEQPLNSEFYFDVGDGFDTSRIIHFQLSGQGRQQIPFYIPCNCHAVRFDPCDCPADFKISGLWLTKMESPRLPDEFHGQSVQFEALGGREGNVLGLKPAHQIVRHEGTDYCWTSQGEDPWFLLEDIDPSLCSGWCRIELRIRSNIEQGNAKFYLDCGKGFNEADSIHVPFKSGQLTTLFSYFEIAPQLIRLDPFDCSARLSVERLSLTNVIETDARHGMLQRLSEESSQYQGLPSRNIWAELKHQALAEGCEAAALLSRCYRETFRVMGKHDAVTYADWISRNETLETSGSEFFQEIQKSFNLYPTISLVMPVYNTPEEFLRKAIESVRRQSYPKWQLCVADDASTARHVRQVLEDYSRQEPRIKVVFRSKNGHISAASNSALALATGEYVGLLDHDDELAEHALHYMVDTINQHPSVNILYSDEDKIDTQGNRMDPHFKSDWNPDLFFSQNYISHLGVYRRQLLERIGGFRVGVEGCQDQDLLLRCLPYVSSEDIIHIPKILYHWRMSEGSTALNATEKSYTSVAGIKVLRDYFIDQGRSDIQVEAGMVPNTYRILYPIPEPDPLVSLLIPTRDRIDLLEPCLCSILEKTTYKNFEIIILDNQSLDPATQIFLNQIQIDDKRVKVLPYDRPFNFSGINNFGVKHANGELVGLINNDMQVINSEWLGEMVSHALRPEIGCVGAKLYYPDDTIQHAGVILGIGGVAGHSHKYYPKSNNGYFSRLKIVQNLSAVTAACLLIRKEIYEQVGGLDDVNLPVAFNDVDFCLKVKNAGYLNLWTPYATLYHYESKSRGSEDSPDKIERFRKEIVFMKSKWGNILKNDTYYNVNLTRNFEDFSIH